MNKYLQYSLEYATQRSYLKDLLPIYPLVPSGLRGIDSAAWANAETELSLKNNAMFLAKDSGPAFHDWLKKGELGLFPVSPDAFLADERDAILDGTDQELAQFAHDHLRYRRNKGLDFVARFRRRYVIGEAKFLTASGGHQNTQFLDALETLRVPDVNAVKIAILDGVVYAQGSGKMYKAVTGEFADANIMSALVLREFLYAL